MVVKKKTTTKAKAKSSPKPKPKPKKSTKPKTKRETIATPSRLVLAGIVREILWRDHRGELHRARYTRSGAIRQTLLYTPDGRGVFSVPLAFDSLRGVLEVTEAPLTYQGGSTLEHSGEIVAIEWQKLSDRDRIRKHEFGEAVSIWTDGQKRPRRFAISTTRRVALFTPAGLAG